MKYYLLKWNPKKWEWPHLNTDIEAVQSKQKPKENSWSCGNTKSLQEGDRYLLYRCGMEPKGIFACGEITSGPKKCSHWEKTKKKKGNMTNFIGVKFEELLNPESDTIITEQELKRKYPKLNWNPQNVFELNQYRVGEDLFNVIIKLGKEKHFIPEEIDARQVHYEGAKQRIVVNSYERNNNARKKCLKHHKAICKICNISFEKKYGPKAKGVIHVHHLKPISQIGEKYKLDPIKDIVPVCPNCHAVIHMKGKHLQVDEVRRMLVNNGRVYEKET
ncbi:EVE domain-containing protein [bacterium]|nr:EVE domain-containing protein [bacterium]